MLYDILKLVKKLITKYKYYNIYRSFNNHLETLNESKVIKVRVGHRIVGKGILL